MSDETPDIENVEEEAPKPARRRSRKKPEAAAPEATSSSETSNVSDEDATSESEEAEVEETPDDVAAEEATEVVLEADDEAEEEAEESEVEAEDEEPEAEAEAPEAASPPPPAGRARGGGRGARQARADASPAASAIPIFRLRWSGRRPSTCARRPARPGWCATTSAAAASRTRELSSLTRRVRSRAIGASCSSRRSPTQSTITSSWARTCTSRRCMPTRVRRSGGSGHARWVARRKIRKRTSHLTILLTPKE